MLILEVSGPFNIDKIKFSLKLSNKTQLMIKMEDEQDGLNERAYGEDVFKY